MDLDLQGSIERFTLPEIFQLIAASRKSGTLGIQHRDTIVMIYFKDGDIIYGYGPRQTFHLGQLLKERGKITPQQLEEAVSIQAKTENSRRLGEILCTRRFIDRADLEGVVREQIEQLLYSLLAWESGSFKFYEDQFPTEEEITVSLSVENVILEGLRRLDERNMIREALPDFDTVYTISASQKDRPRAVKLEAPEWNLMALVNGQRSITDLMQASSMPEDDALKVLAKLKLSGLITQVERKPTAPTESPELEKMVNRLAELFEDYLTEKQRSATLERDVTETMVGEEQ